jgi:hypothetical protein
MQVEFLDFIKNRNASRQEPDTSKSQEQKPETAKEMYTRQAAQDKANQKPIEQIPQADKDVAKSVGERIDRETQHLQERSPAQPSVGETASSPEPMRQTMLSQNKAAPALTPTSAQAGITEAEKSAPSPSKDAPAKAPEKPAHFPQTLPRPRPSWER